MMSIASPAWRATGRVIAMVMLAQAWLYHKAGESNWILPARISMLFSRGILMLGSVLVRVCRIFLGRWQGINN
jgi:hypothetical protein